MAENASEGVSELFFPTQFDGIMKLFIGKSMNTFANTMAVLFYLWKRVRTMLICNNIGKTGWQKWENHRSWTVTTLCLDYMHWFPCIQFIYSGNFGWNTVEEGLVYCFYVRNKWIYQLKSILIVDFWWLVSFPKAMGHVYGPQTQSPEWVWNKIFRKISGHSPALTVDGGHGSCTALRSSPHIPGKKVIPKNVWILGNPVST